MKNINAGDHRHCRRLGFSGRREKAKMDGASLSYKFSELVVLGKNGLMFSRGLITFSTGLHIASMPDFAQSREMIAASTYHSLKRRGKSKQEGT
jgi:hypothetical protein